MSDNDNESANLRAHWSRTAHHTLNSRAVQQQIESTGSAVIASWEHKSGGQVLEYRYEPSH